MWNMVNITKCQQETVLQKFMFDRFCTLEREIKDAADRTFLHNPQETNKSTCI